MTDITDPRYRGAPKAVEEAVELLKQALPGFKALIVHDQRHVRINGALPIGGRFDYESLVLPVMVDARGNPKVEAIVKRIQDLAIDAVNLGPVIAEREKRAHDRGRIEGHYEGYTKGRSEIEVAVLRALAQWKLDQ